MLKQIDAALAFVGALLLVPAVLAFRLAVGTALILLILAWTAAGACRRILPTGIGVPRRGAVAAPGT